MLMKLLMYIRVNLSNIIISCNIWDTDLLLSYFCTRTFSLSSLRSSFELTGKFSADLG